MWHVISQPMIFMGKCTEGLLGNSLLSKKKNRLGLYIPPILISLSGYFIIYHNRVTSIGAGAITLGRTENKKVLVCDNTVECLEL